MGLSCGPRFREGKVRGGRGDRVTDALVNIGATYTVIPRRLAEEIGATRTGIYADVKTVDGIARLEFTHVVLEIEGVRALEAILVSDSLEIPLIGVRTLEGLGFRVDPTTGKLEKTGIYLLTSRTDGLPTLKGGASCLMAPRLGT